MAITVYGFIYKITNNINGKIYIGQTINDIQLRFKEHLRASFSEKMPLHRAIKKYGRNNFSIETIDYALNLNELNSKEEYYIIISGSLNKNIGYNASPGGNSLKRTEESEQKRLANLRKALSHKKGKPVDNFVKYKEKKIPLTETQKEILRNLAPKKKVKAVNKNTGEVLVFNSCSDTARYFGCVKQIISRTCKKIRPHYKGYVLDYIEEKNVN